MNRKLIFVVLVVFASVFGVVAYLRSAQRANLSESTPTQPRSTTSEVEAKSLVPAHFETPPNTLGPTLPPEKFSGKTRQAYLAAREIPQTLAQLPCYCHCDRGMGHQSLHSCFEDDHAAHCDVCINECLMAYRLEKEEHLSAKLIRERIIATFAGL